MKSYKPRKNMRDLSELSDEEKRLLRNADNRETAKNDKLTGLDETDKFFLSSNWGINRKEKN